MGRSGFDSPLSGACPLKVAPAGLILLEIESGQAAQVELLARSNFPLAKISVLQDLAGNDRVVKIQMN